MPPAQQPLNAKRSPEVNAGRIAGVLGLRGELKLDASRVGDDAVRAGLPMTFTMPDGTRRDLVVASVRRHKGRPIITIAGVADATAAEAYVGATVAIAREAAPLGKGEYFDDDLVGCRIIDEAGNACGEVVEVAHYPHQDMLIVGAARTFVPMIREFIARVDVAGKAIHVTVPPGLLDPAAADEA